MGVALDSTGSVESHVALSLLDVWRDYVIGKSVVVHRYRNYGEWPDRTSVLNTVD